MNDKPDDFETPPRDGGLAFTVDLEGFEGPLDVLLSLARDQKVDLKQISILRLADQYLAFVAAARRSNLELAADYLVMAAWLAYLKSRLLIPEQGKAEEPTGDQMAAALAFQLRRLEAMREAGQRLMARPRLGLEIFARGEPERFPTVTENVYDLTLYELLKAYGNQKSRRDMAVLRIDPSRVHSVDDAIQRFRRLLGAGGDWQSLWRFLPDDLGDGLVARSALASTFVASLELTRVGRLVLRQAGPFGPIYVRAQTPQPAVVDTETP